MRRVIWQYWETRGTKPAFVDGLHKLARRNSGCEVVLVTPETLATYLPALPREVMRIKEMAHKADMIRAMLVAQHGGMWLDSDAIVLRDLNWLFDALETHEFVCFNDQARLEKSRPWVRVNCFLSRPDGSIACEWVKRQHAKFPRLKYGWEEIGTELLHPICLSQPELVKVFPFDLICPIPWDRVREFEESASDAAEDVLGRCSVVMLSNASLKTRAPALRQMTCQDIAQGDSLLGAILRAALRGEPVDAAHSGKVPGPAAPSPPKIMRLLAKASPPLRRIWPRG
jgi:Capsular polysaccharide synthesis protein